MAAPQEEVGIKAGNKAITARGQYVPILLLVGMLVISWGWVLYDRTKEVDAGMRQAHADTEAEMARHRQDMERLLAALEGIARQVKER